MKEEIERLSAQLEGLKCKTGKEVEEARVRFLGKKIGRASCRERV